MPKCINLDSHEALAANEGRLRVILRPVKPMSREQAKWLTPELLAKVPGGRMVKGGWQMFHPLAGKFAHGVQHPDDTPLGWIRCPYGSPGDVVVGREAWAGWRHGVGHLRRRERFEPGDEMLFAASSEVVETGPAGGVGVGCSFYPGRSYWRSPATMPAALARHRWTLESVEVVRPAKLRQPIGYVPDREQWIVRWGKKHPFETSWAWKMGVRA